MRVTGNKIISAQKLSIRIFADGFSLYLYEGSGSALTGTEHVRVDTPEALPASLREAFSRSLYHPQRFGSVEVLFDGCSTLVPLDEFRRNEMLSVFRLNFPSADYSPSELRYEILQDMDVVVLYAARAALEELVLEYFPEATLGGFMAYALKTSLYHMHDSDRKGDHFHVFIGERQMTICAFIQGNLALGCAYHVDNDSDRIYYLLSVWKHTVCHSDAACLLYGASKELESGVRKFISKTRVEK